MRKRMGIFSTKDGALTPQTCSERVSADGTRTIHLVPEWAIEAGIVKQKPVMSAIDY